MQARRLCHWQHITRRYSHSSRFHIWLIFAVVQAYKRNIPLKLFEKKKGIAAKRDAQREKDKAALKVVDTTADIPPNEEMKLDSPNVSTQPAAAGDKTVQNPMIGTFATSYFPFDLVL